MAYVAAGTAVSATATLDRDTGALTLNNPTSQSFQIKEVRIETPVTGALNASAWNRISSTNPSWTTTAPADPASTQYASQLAENGGGTTVTLAANGATLNFGNVWNASPYDHMLIYLTLADDSLAVLAPHYTGTAPALGDFNNDGAINLTDYQTLLNGLHTNIAALTTVERYHRGNIMIDGNIDFNDVVAFRTAYDAANGAGAFDAMVAQVPEPSSLVILLGAAIAACGFTRFRLKRATFGILACCTIVSAAGTASAVDIKIDIDSTRLSGTDISGAIATQSGYTSWDLTNVGTAGSMITVDGITFEIFGLAAANQSRVRMDTGGGGGAFDSLLRDFVFNEGAGARAVGLRISGLPVGQYAMQSWHYDSTPAVTSTENYIQVEVRDQGVAGSTINLVDMRPFSLDPASFVFNVTAAGQVKEVIFREDDVPTATEGGDQNRARLNGFTLSTQLPIELTLEVNTTTGAVRIVNEQNVSFNMNYYEIRSAAGSLNLGGWVSLDDAEGEDPVGSGWDEATNSTANILSEVNLQAMSSFAPTADTSIGAAFTPGGTQDLRFYYAGPEDDALRFGLVKYVSTGLAGDYNGDGKVDAADYVVWRKTDGSPAGYNTWRTNFGAGSGAGVEAGVSAIPEPGGLVLLVMGAMLTAIRRRSGCA